MTHQRATIGCSEPGCEYEFHIPAESVAAAEAVFDGWRCHEHDGTTEPDANDILSDLLEHARELTPEDRATAIESLSAFVGGCVAFGNAAPLGLLLGCIELLQATAPEGDHHD